MTLPPDKAYDVIIVGAGVAGASLANALARDGRTVLCIERALYQPTSRSLAEPDRIVGELLQPGGYAKLRELGVESALDGIEAQKIHGYKIFLNGRSICVPYTTAPSENEGVKCVNQETGRGFHNGRFLKKLREMCMNNANVTLVEGTVLSLEKDANDGRVIGVSYRDENEHIIYRNASITIACDGCASTLRRRVASSTCKIDVYSKFYGLVLHMKPGHHIIKHGHVVLAHPKPVLFYPISSDEIRCLVDISSTFTGNVSHYMLRTIAPQLPVSLRDAFIAAVEKGGIKMMPNRVMPAPVDVVPGAILLGDAFNMRHPLTGGGMTVAFSDVVLLRHLLSQVTNLHDWNSISKKLTLFNDLRKPMSSTINILANALYTLFCATNDPALRDMRTACFQYLGCGGRMSTDPMGMLGGLKPQRFLLVAHFFAVALYGCAKAIYPIPTPYRIRHAWRIFRASFNIIKPLIDEEQLFPLSYVPISSL